MHMLYDSDDFVVVHIPLGTTVDPRDVFELVDKRNQTQIALDGEFAKAFRRQIDRWQVAMPRQEEVEEMLAEYCNLAQIPMFLH